MKPVWPSIVNLVSWAATMKRYATKGTKPLTELMEEVRIERDAPIKSRRGLVELINHARNVLLPRKTKEYVRFSVKKIV